MRNKMKLSAINKAFKKNDLEHECKCGLIFDVQYDYLKIVESTNGAKQCKLSCPECNRYIKWLEI